MQNPELRFPAPPRQVPLSLRLVNFFNGGAQIGWAVFGFGMLFFWIFGTNADLSFLTFRNPAGRAAGKITRVEDTNASQNKQKIRKAYYQYSVAGEWLEGKSYTNDGSPSQGDEVTVESDPGHPTRSRIEGMRRALFGPGALAVTIFPAVGLALLIPLTLTGRKRNRLLREGVFTTGTMIDRRPTNVTINNHPVWEVVFEFHDHTGQRRECSARATDTTRLEDEPQEALLYDPGDPSTAYVIDEAPARPKFDLNGQLEGRPNAAALALILPSIVIGAHLLVFWIKFKAS